ncbi:MAG: PAS domain S-box protein [Deltaproteobacteria bacterium]|nr:PAS domain S-box protein [Deltaproteobacteria bacterium]
MPTRQSHNLFSLLAENIKDYAIIITDTEGRITEWGLGAERIFGYSEADIIGQSAAIIFTPEDRAHGAPEHELRTAREQKRAEDERWHVRQDGSRLWVSGITTALFDEQGQIRGFAKLARDTTRRKQTEESLQREKGISDALIASLPGIFYLISSGGEFLRWNQNFERVSGYSGDEIRRMHPTEFFTDAEKEIIAHRIEEVFSLGHSTADACFVTKDGRSIPYFFTGIRVTIDGSPCLIGVGIDVSEQKQAQKEREQLLAREQAARAEAEAANRGKDEFVEVVSHDLRTPLNAITGWLHLLNRPNVDETARARAIQVIEHNVRVQARLIDDLQDISRIRSGTLHFELQPVDVAAAMIATAESLRPAAEAKGLRLEISINDDAGLIQGDPQRLQQLLTNLLSNSIKFTPRGGTIELRLAHVGRKAQITVQDTGIGIKPDFLPHIFDRYASSSFSRKQGGLGLGLVIARHLAELQGGTIEAESRGEGQGATFIVTLPLI